MGQRATRLLKKTMCAPPEWAIEQAQFAWMWLTIFGVLLRSELDYFHVRTLHAQLASSRQAAKE